MIRRKSPQRNLYVLFCFFGILFLNNFVLPSVQDSPADKPKAAQYAVARATSEIIVDGVLDDTAWMQAEVDLIQKAVNKGKVILGSCFGHQIIARALFGMAAVRKRVKPEIGWPDIQIVSNDSLFGQSGRTIHTFIFHYDEVCTVPEEKATIIARSKECNILAFKVKDRPVWGIQPHFEMGIVQGLRYIDNVKGNQVPDRQIFFRSTQYMPKDSGWVIPLMKAFHETHPV